MITDYTLSVDKLLNTLPNGQNLDFSLFNSLPHNLDF